MNPNDFDFFAIHERAEKNIADVDSFVASLKPREYSGKPVLFYFRYDVEYSDFLKKQREEDPMYDTEYLKKEFYRRTIGAYVQAARKYDEEMVAQRRAEEENHCDERRK